LTQASRSFRSGFGREAIEAAEAASDLDDEALAVELRSWFRFWVAEGVFLGVA